MAKPTAEQLAKINQKALVPLTEDQVYTFTARVIGTKLIEKYMMKLTPRLLSKFSEQAKSGVALLIDHPWQKWEAMSFPYGRTYDSRIQVEGENQELYADHYMVLGQKIDDISTDQLAIGIDGGTIFDTSAGFLTSDHKCSICGGQYYNNSGCSHLRGREYDGKVCIIIADDGELMENSIVFDGGYEGAGIVKGSLSNVQNKESEPLSLVPLALDTKSLPGDGRVFYSFSNKSGLMGYVPQQQQNNRASTLAEGVGNVDPKDQAISAQLTQASNLLSQIRAALGVESDDGILGKINSMSENAKVGESHKLALIDEACGAGVRALGEAFSVEAMKLSLANLPVTEIEKVRNSYNAHAQAILGGGGRHTQGGDINLPAGAAAGESPANPQANSGQPTAEQLQAKAREEARAALANTGHSGIMKGEK